MAIGSTFSVVRSASSLPLKRTVTTSGSCAAIAGGAGDGVGSCTLGRHAPAAASGGAGVSFSSSYVFRSGRNEGGAVPPSANCSAGIEACSVLRSVSGSYTPKPSKAVTIPPTSQRATSRWSWPCSAAST